MPHPIIVWVVIRADRTWSVARVWVSLRTAVTLGVIVWKVWAYKHQSFNNLAKKASNVYINYCFAVLTTDRVES